MWDNQGFVLINSCNLLKLEDKQMLQFFYFGEFWFIAVKVEIRVDKTSQGSIMKNEDLTNREGKGGIFGREKNNKKTPMG